MTINSIFMKQKQPSHPAQAKTFPLDAHSSAPLGTLLYHSKSSLHVGQVMRYKVSYTPPCSTEIQSKLFLKIKNIEVAALRAAYFNGPFLLYVHVCPDHYDQNEPTLNPDDQPIYEPQLKPGQAFYAPLHLHTQNTQNYSWTIDIISQIIFSNSAQVQFEVSIATSKQILKNIKTPSDLLDSPIDGLSVSQLNTSDLWHSPKPDPLNTNPLHLVIVTHGLHSNVGADMLYLKEAIDAAAQKTGENIIVRGYFGNVGKTEKGIRYLGHRLADYIVNEATSQLDNTPVKKISFIAHSLGGLVQTYALFYIASHRPDFFHNIKPVNFIALASPFLGISNENPYYVKLALDIGFVGKSGQDLSLMKPLTPGKKPLLQNLPTGVTHETLKLFDRRTLYANIINDGIVPLRTSAILYLDWRALSEVELTWENKPNQSETNEEMTNGKSLSHNDLVSEIPEYNMETRNETNDSETHTNNNDETDSNSHHNHNPTKIISSFTHAAVAPAQILISLFAPSAQKSSDTLSLPNTPKIYKYSQTIPMNDHSDDNNTRAHRRNIYKKSHSETSLTSLQSQPLESADLYAKLENQDQPTAPAHQQKLSLPKKTSVFVSGVSVILPPHPPDSFLLDPAARPTTIIHDRLYNQYDMPPKRFKKRASTLGIRHKPDSPQDKVVERSRLEERIARSWHTDLTWRKVLVRLHPDAHNNIVVRRRFANAYGWPVIDHLVQQHFVEPLMNLS